MPRSTLQDQREPFVLMTTSIIGRVALINFQFDPNKDHRVCRICGKVFQSWLDRIELPTPGQILEARQRRDEWAVSHAKLHSETEHRQLAQSGRFLTPEAVETLAPMGITGVSDIVACNEHENAALQAGRAPADDCES